MNKLGMTEYQLNIIEKELINKKLSLLNEMFTFNHNTFDFDYLIDLHYFLFKEFYFEDELCTRFLNEVEKDIINLYLKRINIECINNNIKEILNYIKELWNIQPFIVGNTRTMIGFLKVLDCAYLPELDIDINYNIKSNPSIFNKIVNQKRLTIKK